MEEKKGEVGEVHFEWSSESRRENFLRWAFEIRIYLSLIQLANSSKGPARFSERLTKNQHLIFCISSLLEYKKNNTIKFKGRK